MTLRIRVVLCSLTVSAFALVGPADEGRANDVVIGDDGAMAKPEQAAATLTLDDVLRSSARASPQIIAALTRVQQAEARGLIAEGAFDTVFDVEARSRVDGYYDGSYVSGEAKRPFTENGGYLYGGYRASRGDFPIYEDKSFTNKLGEIKVGGLYSLMRDSLTDARRSQYRIAGNDIDIARFEAEATAIGVQGRAVSAYQKWVAAGLKLKAYEDLLDLASQRNRAITRQVQLGARPEILQVENEQNLVRRRALIVEAEQEFLSAANTLSLYYRDINGNPIVVGRDQLPGSERAFDSMAITPAFDIEDRPDFQSLLEEIDNAAVNLSLARNELRPRLDLLGELAKDVGPVGLGGDSRTPLEVIVGVKFSVPLQNRKAQGKLDETAAKVSELDIKQRYLREQIRAEVRGLQIELEAAQRLVETTRRERDLAYRLAAAERRRFELGSSDYFLVNQREETATSAEVKFIEAKARIAAAQAALATATADRRALRLGS